MPEISPETILNLPLKLNVVVAFVAFAGILLLILAFSRLRRRFLVSASIYSISGSGLVIIAITLIACSMNFYTYNRLIHEQNVAEIAFSQIAPRNYAATLTTDNGHQSKKYIIKGDEWLLEARIIKWKSPVYLAGMDPLYRLERISGRYRNIQEEKTGIRTVYSLAEEQGLDIWSIINKYSSWIPWVDAYYGSATYLPMTDKARFKITLSQTGLLARPVNDSAEEITGIWD